MLTNLLSLYIASVIQENSPPLFGGNTQSTPAIIKTTGSNLSDMEGGNSIPVKNPEFLSPTIKAKSGIAIDLGTGMILFEKNTHDRLPIASLTKLMTATIIVEENNLEEIITISKNASQTGGSTMFLKAGEKISVKNLLYGILIHSANDAATALAEHNAETIEEFVKKMNKKALALGLLNTKFSNPMGFDNSNNYSSSYDLAKLSKYAYQKKIIKEIAQIKTTKVYSSDGSYMHKLESTLQDILKVDFIKFKGLKTGTTDQAGLCIISIAENENENEILMVLLNSPERFREAKILADWIFRAYNWQR